MNKNRVNLKELSREELENQYVELTSEIAQKDALIKYYEEQLRLNRQKRFGASADNANIEQISFFNEAEQESKVLDAEPKLEETIDNSQSDKKKKHHGKAMKDLPVESIEYRLSPEKMICSVCGNTLHEMSKQIRKEITVIPARVKVTEHIQYIYSCRNCETKGTETPIVKADMPKPPISGSFVSPSLLAYIMTEKYVKAVPLYRQEQQWKHIGVNLTRQNMANWVIKASKSLLKPMYDEMHEELIKKEVLHADETVLEVLCEPNRPPQSNSYMWLYRTGGCDVPIVLYDYQPRRSGAYAQDFLKDFKGYLHVDGYNGYNRLQNITLVGCWAHARRKYTDALKAINNKENKEAGIIQRGLEYINKLFELEQRYEKDNLTAEERYEERLKYSKPVVEEYYEYINERKALPQGYAGKAIEYSIKMRPKLEAFLLDGRLEISNNRAERSIKPFVIGRKNFLFCNTPNGATSSAMAYSIIETAKENNLQPFEYLKYLFEQLPNIDKSSHDELKKLLPWSSELPDYLKTPKNQTDS